MIITQTELKKQTNIDYYDGTLLHSRFAYRFCGNDVLPVGNILLFRAPMRVGIKGMLDIEDLKAKDFIESEDAINMVIEIPELSLFAGVCFQRLFCSMVGNLLSKYIGAKIEIDGDDLIVHKEFVQGGVTQLKGKASVSIACKRGDAVLIHLGINICSGSKAPVFAYSTNLSDDDVQKFMVECNNAFYNMAKDIWICTSKVL